MSTTPIWRDMTPLEQRAVLALAACRFAPATTVKRFARTMLYQYDHAQTKSEAAWPFPKITDRQAALLWKYCHHYRKQIGSGSVVAIEAQRRWVEHDWHEPTDLIKYPFCDKCLTIRRADDMNGPCKGPGKLRAMEKRL